MDTMSLLVVYLVFAVIIAMALAFTNLPKSAMLPATTPETILTIVFVVLSIYALEFSSPNLVLAAVLGGITPVLVIVKRGLQQLT